MFGRSEGCSVVWHSCNWLVWHSALMHRYQYTCSHISCICSSSAVRHGCSMALLLFLFSFTHAPSALHLPCVLSMQSLSFLSLLLPCVVLLRFFSLLSLLFLLSMCSLSLFAFLPSLLAFSGLSSRPHPSVAQTPVKSSNTTNQLLKQLTNQHSAHGVT